MFDEKYVDWNHKRVKAIIDHYGHKFFYRKTILDLGCGQGEIAAAFSRLGADVTCVDARQSNIDALKKKYPHLRAVRCDLDNGWPNSASYDIIFSLGLLSHLKNYEQHLENICIYGEHIILETEVLDSKDPNAVITTFEEKAINDLSFNGGGSLLSSANIQNRLEKFGATFKRMDEGKLNSHIYKYDWQEKNVSTRNSSNRRMWFIKRDKFLAQQFANNRSIKYAEEEAQRQAHEAVAQQHRNHTAMPPRERTAPPYSNYRVPPPAPPELITPPPSPQHIDSSSTITSDSAKYFVHTAKNSSDAVGTMRLFYVKNVPSSVDLCLQKNVDNTTFSTVVIEDQNPTFDSIFARINEITGPDDINIICQSNIFFDDTIKLSKNIKSGQIFALTCWNWYGDNNIVFRNASDSQSAWIIKGKVPNVVGNFSMNLMGSDTKIAYSFYKSKYKVINPSESIKVYAIDVNTTWPGKVDGPHLCIIPTSMS